MDLIDNINTISLTESVILRPSDKDQFLMEINRIRSIAESFHLREERYLAYKEALKLGKNFPDYSVEDPKKSKIFDYFVIELNKLG